ncbi:MAG TPA: site-2 protease family protein [Actinomycetota bacterium]|nr:site-2 protease family protein [Actinomycetota bacterium]
MAHSNTRTDQAAEPGGQNSRPAVTEGGRDMLESSITFLKVRGIPIGAHWSWIVVAAFIAWSLGAQVFPRTQPGLDERSYVYMGAVTAVLFFGSILLHELGHAFQALKEGMKVDGITLWLFGGVARFQGMFPSAAAEFRIAIAGPVVSLLLGIAFTAAAFIGNNAGMPEQVLGVATYLGRINLIVLAFNMVPALPLDGGRVLRAWLWHRQRSFTAATLSAAKAGMAFAYVLMAAGFLSLFSSAVTGGIWFIFLGFFLLQAAQSEAVFARLERVFRPMKVRDLMSPEPVKASPSLTVADFLDWIVPLKHSTYPVSDNGKLLGLISIRMAGAVPAGDRTRLRVRDVMLPPETVPVLDPNTDMLDALTALRAGLGRAVVLDDQENIAGILSISDVVKVLELEQARGPAPEPEARSAGVAVWLVVTTLILLAAAAFYRPPLAVLSPAPALDVAGDITIEGTPVTELSGRYLLLAVQVTRPSALGTLYAIAHPRQDVLPMSAVVPEGVGNVEHAREQQNVFQESQMVAAAAAARAAGMDVTLTGSGAQVAGILPDSPASGSLRTGDVITSVHGNPVNLADDLAALISGRPAGTVFQLDVSREGREIEVEVSSSRLERQGEGRPSIGVLVQTRDFDMDLPFEIDFREREIGGPSAGLAYALAITDMLDPRDLAGGKDVAASGTVRLNGEVGPVGGLNQKASAAEAAGADVLFVPAEGLGDTEDAALPVLGVGSVREAISGLIGAAAR